MRIFSSACLLLFPVVATAQNVIPSPTPAPAQTVVSDPWKLQRTLVDRAILTVEKRVYTLSDVYLILALWNVAVPGEAVWELSNWKEVSGFIIDRSKAFLKQVEKWPPDVQKLIFVVMSYPDLSRQPLGAPTDEEKSNLVGAARNSQNLAKFSPEMATAVKNVREETALNLADIVLRAATYRANKGTLRESVGTLNWFWHQRPMDIEAL